MLHRPLRACAALAVVAALTGCATNHPSLYSWNGYSDHVYRYLKNEASPQEQVLAMEKAIQQTSARQQTLPPGFYAHLGLMYMHSGRTDQALNAWAHEKRVFPESAPYIDYLIHNLQKNKG